MVEWVEYITVENVTLAVGLATFIVTCLTYQYSRKSAKRHTLNLLKRKQAQLKAMEESSRYGVDFSAASHLRVEMAALQAEIEELKNQL